MKAALLATVMLCGCALPPATVQTPTYEVTRVIDGDTIEVTDAGGIRTRIRLRNVDAPELDTPEGHDAKTALEAQLLNRRVQVRPICRDRYGRLIADVE